jgi:hypothetical protein
VHREASQKVKRTGATWKHIVVGVCLAVGLLHFVAGPTYRGPWPGFVRGYLIDILLPLALYLLLGVSWRVLADSRLARAILVLAVGGTVEGLQYLGRPLFGATFDPLDLVMYTLGVCGGVVIEVLVAPRFSAFGKRGSRDAEKLSD